MSGIKRGLRSLGRNRGRNLLVTIVLGLSVALVLVVAAVEEGASMELTDIGGEVGTLIEVRPVGSYGLRMEEPLDASLLPEIDAIEGIRRVSPYVINPLPYLEMSQGIGIIPNTISISLILTLHFLRRRVHLECFLLFWLCFWDHHR